MDKGTRSMLVSNGSFLLCLMGILIFTYLVYDGETRLIMSIVTIVLMGSFWLYALFVARKKMIAIREAVAASGLTPDELSQKTGVPTRNLSLLYGSDFISKEELAEVQSALGLTSQAPPSSQIGDPEKASIGWLFLGVFVPFIALNAFMWRVTKPKRAKLVTIGAIIGIAWLMCIYFFLGTNG